ncbi:MULTISPECIES: twin-arginine translocation signal domain-containing protein [Bacteroidales]|uniref:Twin-arginine translocation signal domain-containing protein n=1 Tax=Phocaeicola vulgatus TaxID=821 RepID=A0A848QZ42_PHOVU|nr:MULTISPECIES: twin-arginine translocation signal domain-containing protein [Bacteroidales]MCG0164457.1 twin-arginine translocation signal domain-containing protein [Phocaeicola vulgatus]MCG0226945.1 twin-arginine translocation signal domain-containing protein [Phocaeicola vulgatus]NMW41397.1 twin-arginine translocation signal domain-containing protein [Phocaeicola vulgatus]
MADHLSKWLNEKSRTDTDRRKFIKTVGAAAGATLLSGVGIAKAAELLNDKTDKKMKIVVLTGSPRRNGNTNHLA